MEAPFNEIERIELEYRAKGKRYADWQKERYPVKLEKFEGLQNRYNAEKRSQNENTRL